MATADRCAAAEQPNGRFSEALPQIVEQVNGRATVIPDGGVRRGTDVFK
ncbi:MAG: alpha-hydroxy-acid oxidizing protein, partial [Aliihoeflea sp.]